VEAEEEDAVAVAPFATSFSPVNATAETVADSRTIPMAVAEEVVVEEVDPRECAMLSRKASAIEATAAASRTRSKEAIRRALMALSLSFIQRSRCGWL